MSTTPQPLPTQEIPGAPKAGWKTSEFWVTVGTIASLFAAQATGHDVGAATVTGATAAASIYSIVRMLLKKD